MPRQGRHLFDMYLNKYITLSPLEVEWAHMVGFKILVEMKQI